MKLLMKITLVLGVLLLFTADSLMAQDMIYQKGKTEAVQAKVIEIGLVDIKYRIWEERKEGVVYSIEKSNVDRIEFENGRTERYGEGTLEQGSNFTGQKKRALKISFLGPLTSSTAIAYEQSIKPGQSMEFKGTIVGLGINNFTESRGFIGAASYRFYRKPSFITSDLKRRHILQGGYFKPEAFIGRTSYDMSRYVYDPITFDSTYKEGREGSTTGGVVLNFGKQWVAGDVFVVDLHAGIGYGGGTSYSGYIVAPEVNVVYSFGLDIGFAF